MFGLTAFSETPLSTQPSSDVEIFLPVIASTSVLSAPTVIREELLVLPLISSDSILYDMAFSYVVALPTITSTTNVYAPSAQFVLRPPTIVNTSDLYAPGITSFTVRMPQVPHQNVFYPISSSLTPTFIFMPLLESSEYVYPFYEVRPPRLVFTGVSYIME